MKRLPKGLLALPRYNPEANYREQLAKAKIRHRNRVTARNLQRSIVRLWSSFALVHHFPRHALLGIPADPFPWSWLKTEEAKDLGINTQMPPLLCMLPSYDQSYLCLWLWPLPGSSHGRSVVRHMTGLLQELGHCVVIVRNLRQAEMALDGYLLVPGRQVPGLYPGAD